MDDTAAGIQRTSGQTYSKCTMSFWDTKKLHKLYLLMFHTFLRKWSMKPLNAERSEHLTISAHDLSLSQCEAGFGNGFSRATPPVSKNLHSWSSICPLEYFGKKIIDINFILNKSLLLPLTTNGMPMKVKFTLKRVNF